MRDDGSAGNCEGIACWLRVHPAVFAANIGCGWSLVNCSEDALAAYCVRMADKLIEAESRIQPDGQG